MTDTLLSGLKWKPVAEIAGENLPVRLEHVLSRRYIGLQTETSRSSPITMDVECTREYVRGLVDAGVEGAGSLRDALELHKNIAIWVE